jgi:hypothetical protein
MENQRGRLIGIFDAAEHILNRAGANMRREIERSSNRQLTFAEASAQALRLIYLRIDNGDFSERGLSKLARLSQSHTHHLLSGHRTASIAMLDRLCKAAGSSHDGQSIYDEIAGLKAAIH